MLSVDYLNIYGPPFPVMCVRKFRSALGGEVTHSVCMCVCVRARNPEEKYDLKNESERVCVTE